ncbi:MAG: hypothetical protein ABMA01_21210, partial [Chthoniobacteraceae bacterium]
SGRVGRLRRAMTREENAPEDRVPLCSKHAAARGRMRRLMQPGKTFWAGIRCGANLHWTGVAGVL